MVISKSKQIIVVNLSSDCPLFPNLYIASQAGEGDLDLSYENHAFPVSISEYGKLRVAKEKSEIYAIVA